MSVLLPFSILGAPGDDALNVADVFKTTLITGDGSAQTINTGLDMLGEGGLVWEKTRSVSNDHYLTSGSGNYLISNNTNAQASVGASIYTFNSSGYIANSWNSPITVVSWSFRRAPKFFDVVTYTGDGASSRNISHNLGIAPGMIVVKNRDQPPVNEQWIIFHRSPGSGQAGFFTTDAFSSRTYWNSTDPTDAVFTVDSSQQVNLSGTNYVAYLFAHDTTDSGIIQCGSYTGNGSTSGPTVTLGWEPQWLLVKRATGGAEAWYLFDNQRSTGSTWDDSLRPTATNAEVTGSSLIKVDVSSTGFQPTSADTSVNNSGNTYIYMAIRAEGA